MSQNSETRLMPAQNPNSQTLTGTGNTIRGEVKAMGKFLRQSRARAWDELSDVDRAVLLEGVRQRREQRELLRQQQEERMDQRVSR